MESARRIRFAKMSGAGNDFIVLDDSATIPPTKLSALARHLCARGRSVGADGLLVLGRSSRADCEVRYFNADGSEAQMCGNGARCAASRAHLLGLGGRDLTLEMGGSIHQARIEGSQATVSMPLPTNIRLGMPLPLDDRELVIHRVDVGVPHVVLDVPHIDKAPVEEWGAKIRNHPAFRPGGTNVNFVELASPSPVPIRTFERGVEGETLACGTGCTAAALVIHWELGRTPPVELRTRGSDILRVRFRSGAAGPSEISLEGEARLVFEGEMELSSAWWREPAP